MKIDVTQYLRPNGNERQLKVEIPDELKEKYLLIIKSGCSITSEAMPSCNMVAQYISHPEGDFCIEMSSPGEKATEALHKMIEKFDIGAFNKWLENLNDNEDLDDTELMNRIDIENDDGLGIYKTGH